MSQESKDKKQRIGSKGKATVQAQAAEAERRQRWANLREELDRFAAALPPFDDSAALIRQDRESH
jgi:hypothetical protein